MTTFDTTAVNDRASESTRADSEAERRVEIAQAFHLGCLGDSMLTQIRQVLHDAACSAEERLRRLSIILDRSTTSDAAGGFRPNETRMVLRGGLAPWQVKRLRLFIAERLSGVIRSTELAQLVSLSPHHFCRAFRVSLNLTPQAFIRRKRVEKACALMKSSRAPLGQIAIECGFADQAHFNRLFRQQLRCSPGAWRRTSAGLWSEGGRGIVETRPHA